MMDIPKYASMFMLVLNLFTIVFFFGFHFSTFKRLVQDVHDTKIMTSATEKKVNETAEKVAYIQGKMSGNDGRRSNQ